MRTAATIALAVVVLITAHSATAEAGDAYLRVISQRAPVHTGPGGSYREVYMAERGDVFEVVERGTKGYWFRIELDDGTTGWVFGELVFPFEVVDDSDPGFFTRMGRSIRRAILAPSPVPFSDVEISFSAGLLDREGLFLLRPSYLVDKYWAFEAHGGLSPRAQIDIFLAGLGWTLRLAPGAAVGPYLSASVGAAYIRPKSDNFIDEAETLASLSAGGGFEITFKKQITVRLDFRNWSLFDPDQATNLQEYTGGLAIFF